MGKEFREKSVHKLNNILIEINSFVVKQTYNQLIQIKPDRLKQESKKLKNAVIMLAYRSESALYATISEIYKDNEKEGRMILKEIFTGDVDMIPYYNNKKLTIR